MGLLFNLLALPAMGPIKGTVWLANKLMEEGGRQLYDEDAIQGQLLELQIRCDLGEVTEEECLEEETILLERLSLIREYKAASAEAS